MLKIVNLWIVNKKKWDKDYIFIFSSFYGFKVKFNIKLLKYKHKLNKVY